MANLKDRYTAAELLARGAHREPIAQKIWWGGEGYEVNTIANQEREWIEQLGGIWTFTQDNANNIKLESAQGLVSPMTRDFEVLQIPGRYGDLLIDHGRKKNRIISIDCFYNPNRRGEPLIEIYNRMIDTLAAVEGYAPLWIESGFDWFVKREGSDETEWLEVIGAHTIYEYSAYFLNSTEPEIMKNNKSARFTLTFSAHPSFSAHRVGRVVE